MCNQGKEGRFGFLLKIMRRFLCIFAHHLQFKSDESRALFFAHLSWKLETRVVGPSVSKLFLFSSSFQELPGQFQTKLAQRILGWRGFKFVQMKGHTLFPRGDNHEIPKIHWRNFKIFFSSTIWPISTTFGTKHSWWRGFKFVQIKGHTLFAHNVYQQSFPQIQISMINTGS